MFPREAFIDRTLGEQGMGVVKLEATLLHEESSPQGLIKVTLVQLNMDLIPLLLMKHNVSIRFVSFLQCSSWKHEPRNLV